MYLATEFTILIELGLEINNSVLLMTFIKSDHLLLTQCKQLLEINEIHSQDN